MSCESFYRVSQDVLPRLARRFVPRIVSCDTRFSANLQDILEHESCLASRLNASRKKSCDSNRVLRDVSPRLTPCFTGLHMLLQAILGLNRTITDQSLHQDTASATNCSAIICLTGVRVVKIITASTNGRGSVTVDFTKFKNHEGAKVYESEEIQVLTLLPGQAVMFTGDTKHCGCAQRAGEELSLGEDGHRDLVVGETVLYKDDGHYGGSTREGVVVELPVRSRLNRHFKIKDVDTGGLVFTKEANIQMEVSTALFFSVDHPKKADSIGFPVMTGGVVGDVGNGRTRCRLDADQSCATYASAGENGEGVDLENMHQQPGTTFIARGRQQVVTAEQLTRFVAEQVGGLRKTMKGVDGECTPADLAMYTDASASSKATFNAVQMYAKMGTAPDAGMEPEMEDEHAPSIHYNATECAVFDLEAHFLCVRLVVMMKHEQFFDELCAQVLHKDIHPESPMFPLHEHVKNTLRAQIKEGPTCSRKDGDKYDVAYADCADADFNPTYLGSPQLRQLIRTSKPFLELLVRIARHRVKSTFPPTHKLGWDDTWKRAYLAYTETAGLRAQHANVLQRARGKDQDMHNSGMTLLSSGAALYASAIFSADCKPVPLETATKHM